MPTTVAGDRVRDTEIGGSVVALRPGDAATTCASAPRVRRVREWRCEILDLDTGADAVGRATAARSWCVGRGMFERLPRRPEKNAEVASTPAGWFHTGDLGQLDELGRLRYLGRAQGHAQGRRRERRRRRDRELPRHAPGGRRSPRSWACPTTATSRWRRRSSSLTPGAEAHRGRAHRVLPGRDRELQDARATSASSTSGRCRRRRSRSSDCATSWSPSGRRTRRTDNQPTVRPCTLTTTRKGRD